MTNDRRPPAGERAPSPRKPRMSKTLLRGWAWILAGVAFFLPLSMFGARPKPAGAEAAKPAAPPEPRVIHRIRRVIVITQVVPRAPTGGGVTYVGGGGGYPGASTGSSSSSSGGGGGGGNGISTGGS